jgi:hypothetical protein
MPSQAVTPFMSPPAALLEAPRQGPSAHAERGSSHARMSAPAMLAPAMSAPCHAPCPMSGPHVMPGPARTLAGQRARHGGGGARGGCGGGARGGGTGGALLEHLVGEGLGRVGRGGVGGKEGELARRSCRNRPCCCPSSCAPPALTLRYMRAAERGSPVSRPATLGPNDTPPAAGAGAAAAAEEEEDGEGVRPGPPPPPAAAPPDRPAAASASATCAVVMGQERARAGAVGLGHAAGGPLRRGGVAQARGRLAGGRCSGERVRAAGGAGAPGRAAAAPTAGAPWRGGTAAPAPPPARSSRRACAAARGQVGEVQGEGPGR